MRKIIINLKLYHTSAGKSTFRTQNDTDLANYRYTSNKKNLWYHVRNVFNRASKSRQGPRRHEEPRFAFVESRLLRVDRLSLRLALALKYVFPYLIRNILFSTRAGNAVSSLAQWCEIGIYCS